MDDELLERAKRSIAREHGLAERDAHRLIGETAAELHADARAMAIEVGAHDPTERSRDDGGRFRTIGDTGAGVDMNRIIREASGR